MTKLNCQIVCEHYCDIHAASKTYCVSERMNKLIRESAVWDSVLFGSVLVQILRHSASGTMIQKHWIFFLSSSFGLFICTANECYETLFIVYCIPSLFHISNTNLIWLCVSNWNWILIWPFGLRIDQKWSLFHAK